MKVSIDFARCEGHGLCEEAAPDLFRLDDEGDLLALFDHEADLPADRQTAAERAVRVCPIGALKVAGR
ncbi:ferredoxin [Streptomyces sp. NPDC047108]|uniref:ferredoxin n=1 Tax=Streptomyces sp. NPDC047108 TaxID=3155025 RepID=UPI0033CF6DB3